MERRNDMQVQYLSKRNPASKSKETLTSRITTVGLVYMGHKFFGDDGSGVGAAASPDTFRTWHLGALVQICGDRVTWADEF